MSDKPPIDQTLREVFAFYLLQERLKYQDSITPADPPAGQPVRVKTDDDYKEQAREKWQNHASCRIELRKQAEQWINNLLDIGIRVRSADSKELQDTLCFMVTIPARPAYRLDEESLT